MRASRGGSRVYGERCSEGADFGVVEAKKVLRRGAGNDVAGLEQHDTGSEKQRFAEIVGDKDDGLPKTAGQGAEFALELGAGDGIERAEGLVHKENGRIGGERSGDSDTLTLAAGKLARAAMREFARSEADKLKHFIDARCGAGGIPTFQAGDETDVFRHGEMGEQAGILNDVTYATAEADGDPSCGRAILDENLSFGGK